VELVRGVVVTGSVVDGATGKGVACEVHFSPLPENTHVKKFAGHDHWRSASTDARGAFRLVTIPGPGVLLAQAHGSVLRVAGVPVHPYRPAAFSPEDARRVKLTRDAVGGHRLFPTAGGGFDNLDFANACRVLDLREGAPGRCDLTLDPGRTLTVKLKAPDGKPLAGALVLGLDELSLRAVPLRGDSCTVYALDPRHPRPLVFLHPGRKLAGAVVLRGEVKGPLQVRLAPGGAVTGTAVDPDGDPLARAEVYPLYRSHPAGRLSRHLFRAGLAPVTDEKGRFRLEGLLPGQPFELVFLKGRRGLREGANASHEVGAGKALDLGRVAVKAGK
jgi:hypothetical protein